MLHVFRNNVMILLVMIFSLLVGYFLVKPTVFIDTTHTQTVKISRGDTLWSIAERVATPEVDIRDVIYAVKELNNISSSHLEPGVTIKVPTIGTKKSVMNYEIATK